MNSTKKKSPTSTSTPTKSNSLKKTHKACIEKKILSDEVKSINVIFNNKKKECDDEIYSTISKFFNSKQSSTEDLIRALVEYYKLEKDKNIDYILTFREFVMLFPRDSSVKDTNFKRQHVFEALCRVILFYNYDNNTFGTKKIFYKSLEKYLENPIDPNIELKIEDIKKEKINSGSSAQSVDIFFKIPKEKPPKEEPTTAACERDYKKTTNDTAKDTYILIQNKFYSDEYSSADKYDINKIYQRASKLNKPTSESEIKIILMVNNAKLLDEKIKKSRNKDMGLVSKIYGLEELEEWFQNMLYDLYIKGIDILSAKSTTMKTILQLRFHQNLFINTTYKYFTNEIISERRKKFIWGAVPRSGKSYIIAGMIEKLNTKLNSNNNILLILGAKTETLEQFKNMFSDLEKFTDYNIITTPSENKKANKSKNIFIFSQEKIKINKKSQSLDFDIKFKEEYSKLFEIKKLDIYFDEVHKGGSTLMSQDKIIDTFLTTNFTIDIFVMVTATYAKPTIAYSVIIDKHDPIIINWSYMDQQNMKEITNIRIKDEIINSRKNSIEKEVLQELFNDYNVKYGEDYLSILEEQYKKHPELVIIQPLLSLKIPEPLKTKESTSPFILSGNIFKLKCSAMGKNLSMMQNPNDIFANNDSVIDLIKFIGNKDNDYFSTNTIYGYLHHKLKYNFSNRHSQIWFLPDNNLYEDPVKCKQELTKTNSQDKIIDETEENNDGLPNIEPLTRGIVLNLLTNEYFKKYFCFLIVHGKKLQYYGKNYDENDIFQSPCVKVSSFEKGKSINKIIQDAEYNAYKENKSLIILTGSMLRLGVSLPCVDIAINFDTVSSIDLNYQTMFRVLTERKDKKYGYYIDLNYERGKNFLYEFNENYGKGFANSNNLDDLTNNIQSLLLLFNYNGLNLINASGVKEADLYNKLIEELKLSKEEYMNHYKGNNKKILEKILLSIGDLKTFDKMKKYIFTGTNSNKSKSNIKINITKKTKQKTQYLQQDVEDETEEEDEAQKEDETEPETQEQAGELQVKDIADLLSTYTSMLAIFSDKYNANCSSMDECIDKTINDVSEKVDPFNCNYTDYNVFGSYINLIKNLNPKQFIKSLELYKELINSDENKTLKNALFIFFDNIREVMKEDKLIYDMSPEEIQEKIEQYLPVRDAEKNEFGEVFTPIALIEEMLDKLPKEVWKNKDYKWLDPANGIGNFPMIAYRKLMEGLKDEIKDNKKRSEHIITNMLYMFEINPKNVGVSRKIFGHDANIFCGDFLVMNIKKVSGIDHFDVIIGNPPWNDIKEGKRKGTNSGSKTLWDKFIKKSLEILNKNGFLGFINPANWRGLGLLHNLWNIISKLQLLYLHIYGENDGKTYFNVGSRFDLYVLQNKSNTKPSKIIDELREKHLIKIDEWSFLPNYNYKIFEKILTSEDKGIDVIYGTNYHTQKKQIMKDKKTSEFKYQIVHSITAEGVTYWYSNDNSKGHFGEPKVILNFNRHQYSHKEQNDYEGKFGMSQISFGIPIKSKAEGDEILRAIDTHEFKKIIASTKWGAFQTDYRMFKYFKPDFYKYLLDKKQKLTRKIKSLSNINTTHKKISSVRAKSIGGSKSRNKTSRNKKSRNNKSRKLNQANL
uniref:site-specific DNA-methyltransferase (adenine-specific) n=1 Tax=viral metagenome TaxID=1070528 RepID=A0A6C0H3Q9_9ZZZZ